MWVWIPFSDDTNGMIQVTYDPFGSGYFHIIGDEEKKEVISAEEVYFIASEEGQWEIWTNNPKFKL